MKKIIYFILFLFFLLLGLIIIPFFIPKKYYLDSLISYAEKEFSVDLEIRDASLNFLPYPEISLYDVKVIIDGPDKKYPFLEAYEINLISNWQALLDKEIILSVQTDKMKTHLIEVETKKYQLDYLIREKLSFSSLKQFKSFPIFNEAWAVNDKLSKKALRINENWMLYLDEIGLSQNEIILTDIKENKIHIKNLNAEFTSIMIDEDVFKSNFNSNFVNQDISRDPIYISGLMNYDFIGQILYLESTKAKLQKIKSEFTGNIDLSSEFPKIDLNAEISPFLISDLKQFSSMKELSEVKGKCKAQLGFLGTEKELIFSYDFMCDDFNYDVPKKINIKNEKISIKGSLFYDTQKISLSKLDFSFGPQEGKVSGIYFLNDKSIDMDLKTKNLDLKWLGKILLVKDDIPQVKGKNSVDIHFISKESQMSGSMKLVNPKMSLSIPDSINIVDQKFSLNQKFSYQNNRLKLDAGKLELGDLVLNQSIEYDFLESNIKAKLSGEKWNLRDIKKVYSQLDLPLKMKGDFDFNIDINQSKDVFKGNVNLSSQNMNLSYDKEFSLQKIPVRFQSSFIYKEKDIKLSKTKLNLDKELIDISKFNFIGSQFAFESQIFSKNISFWQKSFKALSDFPKLNGELAVSISGQGDLNSKKIQYEINSPSLLARFDDKSELKTPLQVSGSLHSTPQLTKINQTKINLGDPSIIVNGELNENGSQKVLANFKAKDSKFMTLVYPEMKALPLIKGISGQVSYLLKNDKSKPELSGYFKADKILHAEYPLGQVSGDLDYKNSILKIKKLRANSLGGSILGKAKVDLNDIKPKYFLDLNFKKISLNRISSLKGFVSGKGDLKLKARGQGFEQKDWQNNLIATGNVSGKNLKFPKLKIMKNALEDPVWKLLLRRPGLIDNKAWNQIKSWSTQVDSLSTKFLVKNGALVLPKNRLKLSGWGLSLGGRVKIDQSLALNGQVSMSRKNLDNLIKDKKVTQALLAGSHILNFPLTISGKTNNPKISLKTSIVGKRITQYFAQQVKQEVKNKVQEKVKQDLKEKIDDIITSEDKKDLEDIKKIEDEVRSWF